VPEITDPDVLRLTARAAELLAALTNPDLAVLLGVLPRRPGESATLAEARAASGLEGRALGKAISRGRTVGVLAAPAPGRLAVRYDGVDGVVGRLSDLSPLSAALKQRGPGATPQYGRLTEITDDPDVLAAVVAVLHDHAPAADLTERQLGEVLQLVGDDVAALRRALVDAGLIHRTPDGSRYRLTPPG